MGKGTVVIRLRLAVIQVQKHRFENPGGRGRGRGTLNGLIEYLLYLANTQQIAKAHGQGALLSAHRRPRHC